MKMLSNIPSSIILIVAPVLSWIDLIVTPCVPIKWTACAAGTNNLTEQISGAEADKVPSELISSMPFICLKILIAAFIAGDSSTSTSSVADTKA